MSERPTQSWVDQHNARVAENRFCKQPSDAPAFAGKESELQERIRQDLISRRWFFVWSRFGQRTSTTPGTPDFIVAMPSGNTLWLEVKVKGAKLSQEQTVARHVLLALGHRYACVYSFEEYLATITAQTPQLSR